MAVIQEVRKTIDGKGTVYEMLHWRGLIDRLIDYGDHVTVAGRYGAKTYRGRLINAIKCYEAQCGIDD